jgi:hypothetical protein
MKVAGIDYRSKFKEINWTADINKELPIHVLLDKSGLGINQGKIPGAENPITVSQAFLEKVQKHYGEECMKMLNLKEDGYADINIYTWA